MSPRLFAQVAVPLPLPGPFTYKIPEELLSILEVGHGVLVPFGARKISGFVVGFSDVPPEGIKRIRSIVELLALEPLFRPEQMAFFEWAARYYHRSLGEVLGTALPSGVQQKSRPVVVLTEEGRGGELGPEALGWALLERLQKGPKKGLALRGLLQENKGVAEAVKALKSLNFIQVEQGLSDKRAKARTQLHYAIKGEPDAATELGLTAFKRPGALQIAVVEALVRRGQSTASELRLELRARELNTGRLPAILRQLDAKGVLETTEAESLSAGPDSMVFESQNLTLTGDQAQATQVLKEAIKARKFAAFLLQGITGSGKTEVYIRAVQATLDEGRQAIVLVPEIGLTPQLLGRFRAHFGDTIAAMHSNLSDQERFDAWRRIYRGEVNLAIGARSAIFAPFRDLGLIVVDEEHDGSFKQDDGLTYSARDLAIVRARQLDGVAILGSATPSLEARQNASRGAFHHLRLNQRANKRPLPTVNLVDMRLPENRVKEGEPDISPILKDALTQTFARGEQAILLLNRRGFAPFVMCPRCGGGFHCNQCDVSLTYHRRRNFLLCHHCGVTQTLPDNCPQCGYHDLTMAGMGTERLEGDLGALFPGVAIARLDRDTSRGREAFLKVLGAFRAGETQLLVGTQMVAKGHDFPGVTCVGILQADYLLNLPDFRASERTFQLVTQVAGRAGRGDAPGVVYVQSHTPEHYSLDLAAEHDFEGFYEREVRVRKLHRYPPFSRMVLFHVSGKEDNKTQMFARELARSLQKLQAHMSRRDLEVVGPAPSPLSRLQGRYRYQILVKAPKATSLQHFIKVAVGQDPIANPPRGVRIGWDVDPLHLL